LHAEADGTSTYSYSSTSSIATTESSSSLSKGLEDAACKPNAGLSGAEAAFNTIEGSSSSSTATAAGEQAALELVFSYSSFSSIDDEVSAVEVEAAKQAARDKEAAAAAAVAAAAAAADKPWWPPTEFAALLGLAVSFAIAGVSNALLCKPVQLNYR
jgi:hypothetical protein